MSYLLFYLSFVKIGLFTIGGGYSAIPLFEAELVTGQGRLTQSELYNIIAVAEITPGPFSLNASTFTGVSVYGFWGGVLATAGFITAPVIITSVMWLLLFKSKERNRVFIPVLRPVTAGIISSAAAALIQLAIFNNNGIIVINTLLAALCLIAHAKFRLSPALVIPLAGVFAVLML